MGGAYGEWTYRALPGSSRTSGGTALPPATPVGQIYFPLEGNTPNPRAKSLGRRPHIFSDLLRGPLKGSWPLAAANLRVRALRQGGPLGTPQNLAGLEALKVPEAHGPAGPWRFLEASGGPWRPLEAQALQTPPKLLEGWLEPCGASWRPWGPACGDALTIFGGLFGLCRPLPPRVEASQGPLRPKHSGGLLRVEGLPACAALWRSKKTIFSRWELRA